MEGLSADRLNRIDAPCLSFVTLPNLSGIAAQLKNRRRARAELTKLIHQHDAVILRMPTQLGLEAFYVARAAGKPVAADLGGCTADGLRAYGTLKARLLAPISLMRVQKAISQMDWVSYVTQEYLQRRYPAADGARTIGCSNVDLPPPDEAPLTLRHHRLDEKKRPLVFGTIGSLHGHFKGVQHALPALALAKVSLPDFEYRVLGGGDQEPWRSLVREHGLQEQVFLDGTLPAGKRVHEWLDAVDVYLQPSLREGVPRALIEAMSRGCPAIASDIAGIPELLPSEALHKAGNVPQLAELIQKAVSPQFIEEHSVRNWQRAQDFTSERLGAVRDEFWGAFAEEARARKGLSKK